MAPIPLCSLTLLPVHSWSQGFSSCPLSILSYISYPIQFGPPIEARSGTSMCSVHLMFPRDLFVFAFNLFKVYTQILIKSALSVTTSLIILFLIPQDKQSVAHTLLFWMSDCIADSNFPVGAFLQLCWNLSNPWHYWHLFWELRYSWLRVKRRKFSLLVA